MFDLYVDNTTDHFRNRWTNCKGDAKKAESGNMKNIKRSWKVIFLQRDNQGFLKDVGVRLIDKKQASDPTKRELYWMETLRTLYPDGLFNASD